MCVYCTKYARARSGEQISVRLMGRQRRWFPEVVVHAASAINTKKKKRGSDNTTGGPLDRYQRMNSAGKWRATENTGPKRGVCSERLGREMVCCRFYIPRPRWTTLYRKSCWVETARGAKGGGFAAKSKPNQSPGLFFSQSSSRKGDMQGCSDLTFFSHARRDQATVRLVCALQRVLSRGARASFHRFAIE